MDQNHKKNDDWVEKKSETDKKADEKQMLAFTRAGGAYIPPAKLKMMQEKIGDKSSEAYQRMNWENLKKKMNGQVNRVNVENIVQVVRTLLQENVLRGKGLLARSIIQAQSFSPSFSHVFAALVAIINSKFPSIGELILRRLVIQFKRSFRRNDKLTCINVSKFLAHLTNQRVSHEIIILEILVLLLQSPTDDSIEVAVTLLKECGAMLNKITPKGSNAIFEQLRMILSESKTIDERSQYMIESILFIRQKGFEGYPIMLEKLDLVEEEDQISHVMELTKEDGTPYDPELQLNVFKYDPDFEKNELEYEEIRKEIIGDNQETSDDESADGEETDQEEEPEQEKGTMKIIDMTEQDLVAFRRNVYLTIQSSLDFQEAAHKLLKNELKPGMESELCHMIVDCCAQLRTYERFYGLLAERFCKLRPIFQTNFEQIARDTYHAIHRFVITKMRNMAKFVAHLLATDAISWEVLSEIKLNENDTTSSGRIYIKYIFEELVQTMSEAKVYERTCDPTLQTAFEGLLPRDNPKNTIFAINFFTLSGLANLTIDLRNHLEKMNKKKKKLEIKEEVVSSSTSSSSSSSDSDSSSDSSSSEESSEDSSSSSSSDESIKQRKKKKRVDKKQLKSPIKKTSKTKSSKLPKTRSPKTKSLRTKSPKSNHKNDILKTVIKKECKTSDEEEDVKEREKQKRRRDEEEDVKEREKQKRRRDEEEDGKEREKQKRRRDEEEDGKEREKQKRRRDEEEDGKEREKQKRRRDDSSQHRRHKDTKKKR